MTTSTPSKAIWIFVVLLALAVIFWKWSLGYQNSRSLGSGHGGRMPAMNAEPASNEDMQKELNASMESSSEIELRGIDQEF